MLEDLVDGHFAVMRARTVWKHDVLNFGGASLEVHAGKVVFETDVTMKSSASALAIRALDADGKQLWDVNWPGVCTFRADAETVWIGGDCAWSVSLETGRRLGERVFGGDDLVEVDDPGIFHVGGVLHGVSRDMSPLWEWPNPDGDWVTDEAGVCRHDPRIGLTTVRPPAMTERTVLPARELPSGVHTHFGDLWCHFGLREGGRTAIDTNTGRVVWHEPEPLGNGLFGIADDRAYAAQDGAVMAYDLRSGRQLWRQSVLEMSGGARISGGRICVGGSRGMDPLIFVLDAATGEVLLRHRLDVKLSGLGFEPSPVLPLGENRIVVGMRRMILGLELS